MTYLMFPVTIFLINHYRDLNGSRLGQVCILSKAINIGIIEYFGDEKLPEYFFEMISTFVLLTIASSFYQEVCEKLKALDK